MRTRRRPEVPKGKRWSVQVRWIRKRWSAGWDLERIARAIELPIESVEAALEWTPPEPDRGTAG